MARTLNQLRQIKLPWELVPADSYDEVVRQFRKVATFLDYTQEEIDLVVAYTDSLDPSLVVNAFNEFIA